MSSNRVDLKVVLLGKEYVGKTALVERFIHERFCADAPYQNTIGAAYGARKMFSNNQEILMGVWDTAGSERYEAMSRIYYRGAKAAIVCYDVLSSESWTKVNFWVQELRSNEENCRIYLCGCKKDLLKDPNYKRAIDFQKIQNFANEIEAKIFETSSKTSEGIYELFQTIVDDIVSDPSFNPVPHTHTITLDQSPPPKAKQKCISNCRS